MLGDLGRRVGALTRAQHVRVVELPGRVLALRLDVLDVAVALPLTDAAAAIATQKASLARQRGADGLLVEIAVPLSLERLERMGRPDPERDVEHRAVHGVVHCDREADVAAIDLGLDLRDFLVE